MHGYWESIPRGTWTIIDPVDAINALEDQDSRFRHYPEDSRLVIFGPDKKALIVELAIIVDSFISSWDEEQFKKDLAKFEVCI